MKFRVGKQIAVFNIYDIGAQNIEQKRQYQENS
jgi:hypothetical protein